MASAQTIQGTFGRTNSAAVPMVFRARDPRTWPAGIPQPYRACDNQLHVPFWDPIARAWRLQELWWDEPFRPVSRATCGDPECRGFHISQKKERERRLRHAKDAKREGRK